MDLDFARLGQDIESGDLRNRLREALVVGFSAMHERGEPLPVPSHFASRIAEILHRNREQELTPVESYDLYQEVLLACEEARVAVLGEEAVSSPPSQP